MTLHARLLDPPDVDQDVEGTLIRRLPCDALPNCAGHMLFDLMVAGASRRFVVSTIVDAFDVINEAPLHSALMLNVWPSRPYPSVSHARLQTSKT